MMQKAVAVVEGRATEIAKRQQIGPGSDRLELSFLRKGYGGVMQAAAWLEGRILSLSRRARDAHGQSLVEFAVVLPVLMLIVIGIFEFGRTYNQYLRLTDAVRVGGRAAATQQPDSPQTSPPNQTACSTGTSAATTNWSGGSYTCDGAVTIAGATGSDPAVKITGTAPFTIKILGLPVFSGNLTTSTTERLA
jgi:Flp pilus assembly protein TadG